MSARNCLLVIMALAACSVLWAAGNDARNYCPSEEWRAASPEVEGMDSARLSTMSKYIREKLPQASSVLLVRNGYIVYEEYFRGAREDLRSVRSVTKSVVSALVGIALEKGLVRSIDQRMLDFFPEVNQHAVDPSMTKVTLRHLLTETVGFPATPDPDLFEALLTLPLTDSPGNIFKYSDDDAMAVSLILAKATGLKAARFAETTLFKELGISRYRWQEMGGHSLGGDGLSLTSRDMAKIGYLYLNEGDWCGEQIMSANWVVSSTHTQISPGGWADDKGESHGFYWWCRNVGPYEVYYAYGIGGQVILDIPALDLVFVSTSEAGNADLPISSLVENYILPSMIR